MTRNILQLGGGSSYRANAVHFGGTNEYLTRGAQLTGVTDTKLGTISFWLDPDSDDVHGEIVSNRIPDANSRFNAHRGTNNKIQFFGRRASDNSNVLSIETVATILAANGWVHVIASWDLGASAEHIYLNDVSSISVATSVDDTINYDAANNEWTIGSVTDTTLKLSADIADLWFDNTFLDISVEANRRKFISPNLKPVNLGEEGQLPTGASPLIFLSGPTVAWHTNKGTGGGFTENGTLADGSSSPSD